jgi:lipopolysaccharide transport system ATP-binding protein
MSHPVISVERLSKRYTIGHVIDRNDGLRHAVESAFRHPMQWIRERAVQRRAKREDFWALRDVAFQVMRGDVVGIIGRNGAGKSTLLKILSRITEPTTGRIVLDGRVASLLEVGTGFHQELTGRENIFLNGAILGMSKSEIRRKFDEIVAFSEIEKFLDTPVKRYSSGMYVRLAFAVAAHLEPEILIVDEVLAVGDAAFQKKCLGKMGEVAKGGRTVLFVSHNMPAVQALCTKAIYLQGGKVRAVGDVEGLLQQYLVETASAQHQRFQAPLKLGHSLKLLAFDFAPNPVESGAPLRFTITFTTVNTVTFTDLSLLINTPQGTRVALVDLRSLNLPYTLSAGETWSIQGTSRSLPFVEGDYSVGLGINIGEFHENVFDLANFSVSARNLNSGYAPYPVIYRGMVELDVAATSTSVGPHVTSSVAVPHIG